MQRRFSTHLKCTRRANRNLVVMHSHWLNAFGIGIASYMLRDLPASAERPPLVEQKILCERIKLKICVDLEVLLTRRNFINFSELKCKFQKERKAFSELMAQRIVMSSVIANDDSI